MRGSSSKAPPPASREVRRLVDSCSDLIDLVCDGLFLLLDDSEAWPKLRTKVYTLQSCRLLSKQFRVRIDRFVLSEMHKIHKAAGDSWAEKRNFQIKRDRNPGEDAAILKEMEAKWHAAANKLTAIMRLYFPTEVVTEYTEGVNAATGFRLEQSRHYCGLHCTVAMFFAMATQRCYMHTCGGFKLCTKTHSRGTFHPVRFADSEGREFEKCIYSQHDCVRSLSADSNDFNSGKMSTQCRLVVEMYRRRGVFEQERVRDAVRGLQGRRSANHVYLCLSHPDIDLPSVEKTLGITPAELELCRAEVRRKDQQRQRFNDEVALVRQRFLMEDVEAALQSNTAFGFESFAALERVLPGLAGVVRQALVVAKETSGALQVRMVAACFAELSFLMGPVRKLDKTFDAGGMASREAYDFVSGKSAGVLMKYDSGEAWKSVSMGVGAMQPAGNEAVLSAPQALKSWSTADKVCAAMRLFDLIDEEWQLRPRASALVRPASRGGPELGFALNASELWERLKCKSFYRAVCAYVDDGHDDITMPEMPSLFEFEMFTRKAIDFAQNAFRSLMSSPATKCLAMRLVGVSPSTLCAMVSDRANRQAMRALELVAEP